MLLWLLMDPGKLRPDIRSTVADPMTTVFVSSASVWEMGIKKAIGKLKTPDQFEEAVHATGFSPLTISWAHALLAGNLPPYHNDPFDRMLIAQAKLEGLTLLTHDRRLKPYGTFVHLV